MKKLLSLLLCSILLLGALGNNAQAMGMFGGGVMIERYSGVDEFYINSFAKVGDTVYALANSETFGIYTVNISDGSYKLFYDFNDNKLESGVMYVYAQDDKLMLITYSGDIAALNPADKSIEIKGKLDLNLDDIHIDKVVFDGEVPVMYYQHHTANTSALRWMDDSAREVSIPNTMMLMGIAPYKDGAFIAVTFNGYMLIKDGKITPLQAVSNATSVQLDIGAIFFDKDTQSLYITEGNYIYKLDDNMEKTQVGYIPFAASSYQPYVYQNGSLLYTYNDETNNSTLSEVKISEMSLPQNVVKVYGLSEELSNTYNRKNPDMPIATGGRTGMSVLGDATMLANHMKGSDANDVYFFFTNDMSNSLAKHGYIEPLTGSEKLMANYNRMYPYIQDAASYNGTYYFMPTALNRSSLNFQYDPKALEALGMKEDELPTNYADFIRFLKEAEELAEDSEYKMFEYQESTPIKLLVSGNLLQENFAMQLRAGEKIQFNTPQMLSVMKAINDVQFDTLPNSLQELDFISEMDVEKQYLLKSSSKYIGIEYDQKPLPLSIEDGKQPLILVSMPNAVVNALSPNKAAAIQFLERFSDTIDEVTQTCLYSDKTEQVLDQNMLRRIAAEERYLADLQKSLAEEKEEKNKKSIEQDIAQQEAEIAKLKARSYAITSEDLAIYKEQMNDYYILTEKMIDFQSQQQMELLQRFFSGQIEPENFLSEFDRIVNMSMMEGE